MAWFRNIVGKTIIVALVVCVNGKYFGNRKVASKSNGLDPATSRLLKTLSKQTQIDKMRTNLYSRTTTSQSNFSSPQIIHEFVLRKFKSEMVQLFTFLPKKYRCDILRNLSRTSQCDDATITGILRNILRNSSKLKCPRGTTYIAASKCSDRNATNLVVDAFWNQMGQLFSDVSIPFQCSIVNKIPSPSLTSSKRRRLRQSHFISGRAPRVSLQTVEKELQKRFPTLNLKQNCSRVWKPLKDKVPPKSPASLVNVTVQLNRRRVRKKAWIRRFKKKAHQMYMIYYNYHAQTRRQRPLIDNINAHPSNPPLLSRKHVRLTVIKASKVNRSIVAVFSLEVRKPGAVRYSKITPAKQIIKPLQAVGSTALRRLFGGTVVHLSDRKSESGKNEYRWLNANTKKAMLLFPKHLVPYYRSLDRLRRCLVMLYISSILQLDLRPVEMFYTSLGYVPRKYFCSSARSTPSSKVSIEILYRANGTRPEKPNKTLKDKRKEKVLLTDTKRLDVTDPKVPSSETPDVFGPEEAEEQSETTSKVTPLEIGLFVVLAFLCITILVFTINCIIFALKKKSASSEHEPNTSFAQAIQLRKVESRKVETQGDNKVESERHLQIALLTEENCSSDKKRENIQECCSSQGLRDMREEAQTNDSLKEETFHLRKCNEYSADPLSSLQNLHKESLEEYELDDDSQTWQSEDSDKTDNESEKLESDDDDDDDITDSDDNDCSTKIRTTRI